MYITGTGAGSGENSSSAGCCGRCCKKGFDEDDLDDDDLAQAEAALYQQGVRMEKEKARRSQAGELGDAAVNSEQPSRREMIAAIRSSDEGDDADPARASLMEQARHSRSPSS